MNEKADRATLGDLVVRAALIDARRHIAAGATPGAAASRACRGAWVPYRRAVEQQLHAEAAAGLSADDGDDDRLPDVPAQVMVEAA